MIHTKAVQIEASHYARLSLLYFIFFFYTLNKSAVVLGFNKGQGEHYALLHNCAHKFIPQNLLKGYGKCISDFLG